MYSSVNSMKRRIIDVDPRLDLYILIYPSFIFPLVSVSQNKLVKIWGVCKDLTVYKNGSKLIIEHKDEDCLYYADDVLGIWSLPLSASTTSKKCKEFVELLIDNYGWIGIATSPLDDIEIFSSIYLSQNTDFHRNVVKWVQTMFIRYRSIETIVDLDVDTVIKDISRSYQLLQFAQTLRHYLGYRRHILEGSISDVKHYLFSIKGIGPKIFNAYIMYIKKSTFHAPIDKNLIMFLEKFDSTLDIISMMPRKDKCMRYACDNCPINNHCTYYRFYNVFGKLSGWIQTIAYIHNKLICKHGLCKSCILSTICRFVKRLS